jgi:hypothetical protein
MASTANRMMVSLMFCIESRLTFNRLHFMN